MKINIRYAALNSIVVSLSSTVIRFYFLATGGRLSVGSVPSSSNLALAH